MRRPQVRELSEKLNSKLEALYADPQARSWFKMFRDVDEDGSGRISYQEFSRMVRRKLKLGVGKVSEEALQGVWRALDEDTSGYISIGEFGNFMRKGRKGKDGGDDGTYAGRHAAKLSATRRRVAHEAALAEETASRQVIASTSQVRGRGGRWGARWGGRRRREGDEWSCP